MLSWLPGIGLILLAAIASQTFGREPGEPWGRTIALIAAAVVTMTVVLVFGLDVNGPGGH